MYQNTSTQSTTFWQYLINNAIAIPIIQRDYAQGRLGREYLRKSFLTDLKKALDSNEQIKLDFIYGAFENKRMNPLDGQQRLTTLWLLHWYIALMSGELNETNCQILNKYTYETRISSREFCKELCTYSNFSDYKDYNPTINPKRKIVEYITSRTWFFSEWKQDPTIQSMLRMLGGTEIKDNDGDITDGLEEVFSDTSDFRVYWERLTNDNAPIVFYSIPLKDFGLSDDLYVKMNARGKQLTSFENFKADLIGYITSNKDNSCEKEKWSELLDVPKGISIKLDTDWTNIFWENKSSDYKIDEIYFAFINRFFLNELICQKDANGEDYLYTSEELEKGSHSFMYLYEDNGMEYNGDFKIYYLDKDNTNIPISFFHNLQNVLDRYKTTDFLFIPKYNDDGSISTITQKDRVIFHAISKYLQKGIFEEKSFLQWIRVANNLAENANVNSIATMIGAMRLIDELGEHSHEIYTFLDKKELDIKSNVAKEQVVEEIAKVNQILHGEAREDGITWEDIIKEAENSTFFKGAIRFLFTDENGNFNWKDFDTKWKNAQIYFDENGVKKDYKVELTRKLVIQCNDWENQLYEKQIFNPNDSTWKRILCSKNWKYPIHNILTKELNKIQPIDYNNDSNIQQYITPLLKDLPFEWIINNIPEGRFRWKDYRLAFFKPYGREFILFDWSNFKRREILSNIDVIRVH